MVFERTRHQTRPPRSAEALAAVAALAMLALVHPAAAQEHAAPPDQTPADKTLEDAKALTHQAEIDYKLGRFDAALTEYSDAYQKVPAPGLLLNIGQCHRMLKQYEQAIFSYKGYLRDRPDAPNQAAILGLIDESQHDLDAQKAQAAPAPQGPAPPTPPPPPALVPTPPQPAAGREGLGWQKTSALVAGGVGAVGLGVGVVVGVVALSDKSSAHAACPGSSCPTEEGVSKWSTAAATGTASTVALVAGAVCLAGGVVLWLTAPRKGDGPSAQVGIGPAALHVRGSW